MNYHIPVLVDKVCDFLLQPDYRVIVDATVGDGGHSLALLAKSRRKIKILGLDQDQQAIERASDRFKDYQGGIQLVHGNFADLTAIVEKSHIDRVDGVLADLGLSLNQVSNGSRGFSYLVDGPLRMTMNLDTRQQAYDIVNGYTFEELSKIIIEFGEEHLAKRIANKICTERQKRAIETTAQLADIIRKVVPARYAIKSIARVFQAIRIKVNNELVSLARFLPQTLDLLAPGGRLAIIAYHSLEDRMVKTFTRDAANPCKCSPELPRCVCGMKPKLKLITRKVVRPGKEEIAQNSSARSARLRIAEKL